MLRCIVITILLVTPHVKPQADNVDDQTLEWIQQNFPEGGKKTKKEVNLQPSKQDSLDDIVKWVVGVIDTESKNKTETTVNLDPSNVVIKNSSLSKPAQAPANKFDDKIDSTPRVEKPCTSEDGMSGVCVLYYLCDPTTRKVIGDGTHLIDVRFGESERDCPHYLDICCHLEDRVAPKVPMLSQLPPQSAPGLTVGASAKVPGAFQQCGWNNPDLYVFQPPNQDIADQGVYANYGEFRWMVALMRKSGTKVWVQNDYIGGGSLIHPSVVMTAYHKLLRVNPEELKCRAGEWDTQTDKEQFEIQERDADRFVSHPEFYRTSVYNDIALIFLKSPFDLADAPHIGTACLAPVLPDSATCFSMGWGKDVKTDEYVNILKKVRLSLVEHKTCETLLHTNTRLRHTPNYTLHASLTCAGGEEYVDTCQGDGGSSLVCPIGHRDGRTRYAVVGMVAYGLACGKRDVPGVYVNVPHLHGWVQQQMRANGYSTDAYTY